MAMPLMEVTDLAVHFPTRSGVARALDGVSLEWRRGEILGVVGALSPLRRAVRQRRAGPLRRRPRPR